jgi:hypothetical protein
MDNWVKDLEKGKVEKQKREPFDSLFVRLGVRF